MVGLDRCGQVRDFYFPFVGLENQAGGKWLLHRVGVWIDSELFWLDNPAWDIQLECLSETFAGRLLARHKRLLIELEISDVVYNEKNIFLRRISLKNAGSQSRQLKFFYHQGFELYESHRGDTAYFDPTEHVVIHYKGRRVMLANLSLNGRGFDDYGMGSFRIEGKEGSYKDAEDGKLSKNPIEHGRVDSTVGLSLELSPGESKILWYWLAAAKSIEEAKSLNQYVLRKTPEHLQKTTQDFWKAWVNRQNFSFFSLSPELVALFKKSLFVLRAHVDNNGAVIASTDSDMLQGGRDTYAYMWPRDGALTALALDRAGDFNVAKRFFEFCSQVITQDGYFMHKYRADKSLGSSWHSWIRYDKPVLPIQEDETALVVYALWEHYQLTKDLEFIENLYNPLIKAAAEFMAGFLDTATGLPFASYDLWEEKYGSSTFTAASVYGALLAAANFAELLGKSGDKSRYRETAEKIKQAILEHLYDDKVGFYKMVYYDAGRLVADKVVDMSSVYGIFKFGVLAVDDAKVKRAIALVEANLCSKTPVGGVPRYQDDRYYQQNSGQSNPWFITTLWLAQYYIALAKNQTDLEKGTKWLDWTLRHATATGMLSEQLHPETGAQLSATPLTWSHSEYVVTIVDYLEKLEDLGICLACNPIKSKHKENHL